MHAQILWNSRDMLPLVIALAVALVTAVVWLYPAQVRRVRWPWRWVLPGLRATALLVLCASLLQPAFQRLRRAEERGAVLVLIDRSRSMSVTDLHRSPAQIVALADGLGRLPAGARTSETAGLSSGLERLRECVADVVSAGHDLETAAAFGRGIEAARARLAAAQTAYADIARSLASQAQTLPEVGELRAKLNTLNVSIEGTARDAWAVEARARIDAAEAAFTSFQIDVDRKLYETNPQVKAVCDELAKLSRWSLAEQALLRAETGLIPRIASEMPVLVYAAADGAAPLALPRASESRQQLPVQPDRSASNIVDAVSNALADVGDRPLRVAVLFSDGRQVGGQADIVSGLSPTGVPVFTVAMAPQDRPLDLAFAQDLSIPASAFIGETVTIRTSMRSSGLPAPAADVQLHAGEVVQSQQVALKADAASSPVEFSLRLEHAGPQRVVIGVPPAPGEITAENNVIERWVKVLPERMKVAAYAATPGWDFQLLRGALSRTPWVRLEAGMLDVAAPRLPLTPEQILRQDVIVLSDVPAGALDDVQWDAVNRLVRERGGSLFLLAGPDHLPATYTPDTIVASALLPYDVRRFSPSWRTWPGEQAAFRFVPAPQLSMEQSDALRLGPGAGSVRHWQGLSGAFRFMPVTELNQRLSTRALLVEADSRTPVLTESFPGNGRVFFLGTNETWRWRYKVGERDFDRFWLQLIRYAAGEPYAVQRDTLALDIDKVAPAPDQPVTVRARILQSDADAFRIEVRRDGTVIQEQKLSPTGSAGSGRFSATISGLEEGDYVVRLSNPGDQDSAAVTLEVPLHVAASSEAEMADVSGDHGLLRRIADASGGEFLTLDRVRELPRLLTASGENRSRYSEVSLWDSPLLFVFVVACLAAEWALRKRVGLA